MSSLKAKHRAALELLKSNTLTIKEVAKQTGIAYGYLQDMMAGDAKAGNVGLEFHEEYSKIEKEIDKRIKRQTKEGLDLSTKIIHEELLKLEKKQHKSHDDLKIIKDLQMALSKSRPSVEIGHLSYTKGLNAEDLINEFKRLRGIAEAALDRRTVQRIVEGRAGEISLAPGPGDTPKEGEQDSPLPPSQAPREFPQEPFSD